MYKKPHITPARLFILASLITTLLTNSLIFAQDDESTEGTNNDNIFALMTSTTGSLDTAELLSCATAAGIFTTSGVATIFILADAGANSNQLVLRSYILNERESLHAAHATGGGDAVHDMSTMLWVPDTHRWLLGAAMRHDRAQLDAALMSTCDTAATCDALADRYIAILLAAVEARPESHVAVTLSP